MPDSSPPRQALSALIGVTLLQATLAHAAPVATIRPPDQGLEDRFGWALASHAEWLAVGAPGHDAGAGAVYIYRTGDASSPNATWTLVRKLVAPDGGPGEEFGSSVAMDGERLIVALERDRTDAWRAGRVFVYRRDHGGPDAWGLEAELTAPRDNDYYGASVDLFGTIAVVGAPDNDHNIIGGGTAYVFEFDPADAAWSFIAKLSASDPGSYERLGWAVSTDGNRIAAAGQGIFSDVVRIFKRDPAGEWIESAKLTNGRQVFGGGWALSVDLWRSTLAWGTSRLRSGEDTGTVFLHTLDPATRSWGEARVITPWPTVSGARFGQAVVLDRGRLIVGAVKASSEGTVEAGAIYEFGRHTGGLHRWGQLSMQPHPDGESEAHLGAAVAQSGNLAYAGAPSASGGTVVVFFLDSDRDRDRLPDKWEIEHFGGLHAHPARDPDFDGLVNLCEFSAHTDPLNPDTDGEGLPDGREVLHVGSDPLDTDTDSDGLDDAREVRALGTNPLEPDSDGDGLTDFDECETHHTDPLRADTDRDGFDDAFELADGSDPNKRRSLPRSTRLTAGEAGVFDQFGWSVDVDGGTVVVGALRDDDRGREAGAVYVFSRDRLHPRRWHQRAKLTASDGKANDGFGATVAIDGGLIAVGLWSGENLDDDEEPDTFGEAVYLFRRSGHRPGHWEELAKLTAPDGQAGDMFGMALALTRDQLAVGAPMATVNGVRVGKVYLYDRPASAEAPWIASTNLTPSDPTQWMQFGAALALHGDRLAVGAPYRKFGSTTESGAATEIDAAGAVYQYRRDGGGPLAWELESMLTAHDPTPSDRFGSDVALSEDWLAVGRDMVGYSGRPGAVYLYGPGSSGAPTQVLPAPGPGDFDTFGRAIALEGMHLATGDALNGLSGDRRGAAFAYRFRGDDPGAPWEATERFAAPLGHNNADYGQAIAMSGNHLVVGAPSQTLEFGREGAVYVIPIRLQRRYRDWLAEHFSVEERQDGAKVDPSADPDGDGRKNHFEYVFGGNPRNANDRRPRGLVAAAPHTHDHGPDRCACYSFDIPEPDPDDVEIRIQACDDLRSGIWHTIASKRPGAQWEGPVSVTDEVAAEGGTTCTVHLPIRSVQGQRYFRLLVVPRP